MSLKSRRKNTEGSQLGIARQIITRERVAGAEISDPGALLGMCRIRHDRDSRMSSGKKGFLFTNVGVEFRIAACSLRFRNSVHRILLRSYACKWKAPWSEGGFGIIASL